MQKIDVSASIDFNRIGEGKKSIDSAKKWTTKRNLVVVTTLQLGSDLRTVSTLPTIKQQINVTFNSGGRPTYIDTTITDM